MATQAHVMPPSVIGLMPFEKTSEKRILNPTPANAAANRYFPAFPSSLTPSALKKPIVFSTAMAANARMKRGNVFCTTEQYSFSADHLKRGFKSDTFKSLEETFARLPIVAIEG